MIKHYIILVVYIALCVGVGIIITKITPKECFFSLCKKKAKLILDNMEQQQSPCQNFYNFTCGRYEGFHEVKLESSIRDEMKEFQLRRLAAFIGAPTQEKDDRVLKVLKLAYKSCMDLGKIESEGITPLLHAIEAAGGFPLAESSRWEAKQKETSGTDWSLNEAEKYLRYVGFKGGRLIQSEVRNTIELGSFILVTPPENLDFPSSNFEHFFKYVKQIVHLLQNTSTIDENELKSTLDFKRELSRFHYKVENCSSYDSFRQVITNEFSNKFKAFNVSDILQELSYTMFAPQHMYVTHVTQTYLEELEELLRKTDKRVVANYLMIENIIEVTPMLPKAFRDAYGELLAKVKGALYQPETSRKEECVKSLLETVSSALSALYLKKELKTYVKPAYLRDLVVLIKKHMLLMVSQLSWMDVETKKKALWKINDMDYDVPLSKYDFNTLTDDTLFRVYYEDLCFPENTTDTLSAFLALQRFESDKKWELTERNFSTFDKEVDVFRAEVQYDYMRNLVLIPMSFLMYPTFDRRWPHYLNYGGLGTKAAMELSRGIDHTGSHFINGRKTDWWSIETKSNYRQYPNCFVSQYNEHLKKSAVQSTVSDPACVRDSLTIQAGLEVAYGAYLEYDSLRFFPERGLPHLKQFSPIEMFFIDFATFHCATRSKAEYYFKERKTEEELSEFSDEYLVNNALRNFPPFSQTFKCPDGAKMNPGGKCGVWWKAEGVKG